MAKASEELLQARRRIYLRHRIPALRDEMQSVVQQTQEIAAQFKEGAIEPGTDRGKKMREQLIYLREHGDWLRTHLKALTAEKKSLTNPGHSAAASDQVAAPVDEAAEIVSA